MPASSVSADNKNLRKLLIKYQKELFSLEDKKNTEKRRGELTGLIKNGLFQITGEKQGEQYMSVWSSIKDEAMATLGDRTKSTLEIVGSCVVGAAKKVFGYKMGGSVGYTQRWKNARKKNG